MPPEGEEIAWKFNGTPCTIRLGVGLAESSKPNNNLQYNCFKADSWLKDSPSTSLIFVSFLLESTLYLELFSYPTTPNLQVKR